MQYTNKLGLKKPDLTDYVQISDLNENMDILDQEIAKITDEETGVDAKLTQHLDEIVTSATPNKILKLDENAQYPLSVLGGNVVKNNFNALRPPSASDNPSAGYSVGSLWIYKGFVYQCFRIDGSNAIWTLVTLDRYIELYNAGVENIPFTQSFKTGTGTFTKESSKYKLTAGPSSTTNEIIVTSEIMDLSKHSTVNIQFDVTVGSPSYANYLKLAVQNTSQKGSIDNVALAARNTNEVGVLSLDISNLYGNYYVSLQASSSGGTTRSVIAYISKIWFE